MLPLTDLFIVPRPQYLNVADRPLRLGGQIRQVPIELFEKEVNCIYNDGITIRKGSKVDPFEESYSPGAKPFFVKQIESSLTRIRDRLVLCKMGDLGYGVFAVDNIRPGTVLALYAGTITKTVQTQDSNDYALTYYKSNFSFSTRHHRGISSFMQHLPDEKQRSTVEEHFNALRSQGRKVDLEDLKNDIVLYSTRFDDTSIEKSVMTQSVDMQFLNYKGVPMIAMVASRFLKRGDQLGYNYGSFYWQTRGAPSFFTNEGNTISRASYVRTSGYLRFKNFTYTGDYEPLVQKVRQGKLEVEIQDNSGRTHRIPLFTLFVKLVLAGAARPFLTKSLPEIESK